MEMRKSQKIKTRVRTSVTVFEEKTKIYWWENENKAATGENNGRILQQVLSFYINNNTTTTNGIIIIIIINPFFTHYLFHSPHLTIIILTTISSNMFGGLINGHPEEHRSQYDMSALPQLQLFGKFPVGCTIDNINFVGNEHGVASNRPIKRAREPGPMSAQQKLHISLNSNFCQDETGLATTSMNPNPVSTGLKLSYEEDERNSSITSIGENLKALHPVTHSLTNSIKLEMDRHKELLDHYVKVQEENMAKGIRELNQKHTASILNTLEKEVVKKLREKEMEIEKMNRKNMELVLKVKQVAMEAQSWHYRAKYNESVVNALKNNLQQVIAQKQPVEGKEGYGDSEVDDTASYTNNVNATNQTKCRACNTKEVCVLLLPCRHLCLCKDCQVFTENCPVCQATTTESVHVFMS